MNKLLYISMLGEPSIYNVDNFKDLCSSGLERDWIIEWLHSLAAKYDFQMASIDICRGDELPPPNTVETLIVGGTSHDVRDKFEWLTNLTAWLKEYRSLDHPLLGICGAHQLVSIIFEDGEMEARDEGRLAGTYSVIISERGLLHPIFKGISQNPKFHFGNSFYVVPSKSLSTKVLASVGKDSAIAIDHGRHWYSCQFHPESEIKTWKCYFKGDDEVDLSLYSEDHDGRKFVENFLRISKSFLNEKSTPTVPVM